MLIVLIRRLRASGVAILLCSATSCLAGPGVLITKLDYTTASLGYGSQLAVADNQLLVSGAGNALPSNEILVYDSQLSATPIGTIRPPSGIHTNAFGAALVTSGSRILAGAADAVTTPTAETSRGVVLLYDSTTDTNPQIYWSPITGNQQTFGSSIAWGPGNLFAVSHNGTEAGQTFSRVYVYEAGDPTSVSTIELPTSLVSPALTFFREPIHPSATPGSGEEMHGALVIARRNVSGDTFAIQIVHPITGATLRTIDGSSGTPTAVRTHGNSIVIATGVSYYNLISGKVHFADRTQQALIPFTLQPQNPVGFANAMELLEDGSIVVVAATADAVYVYTAGTFPDPTHVFVDPYGAQPGGSITVFGNRIITGRPGFITGYGVSGTPGRVIAFEGPSTPAAPPETPQNFNAVAANPIQVNVTFSHPHTRVNRFIIERREETTSTFRTLTRLTPDRSDYADITGLKPGSSYCYRMKAVNPDGETPYTPEICVTLPTTENARYRGELQSLMETGEWFGYNLVGLPGNYLAVSAQYSDLSTTQPNTGAVYIYRLPSLTPRLIINNPAPQYTYQFGDAMCARGDDLVVATWNRVFVIEPRTGKLLHSIHGPLDRINEAVTTLDDGSVVVGYAYGLSAAEIFHPPLYENSTKITSKLGDSYIAGHVLGASSNLLGIITHYFSYSPFTGDTRRGYPSSHSVRLTVFKDQDFTTPFYSSDRAFSLARGKTGLLVGGGNYISPPGVDGPTFLLRDDGTTHPYQLPPGKVEPGFGGAIAGSKKFVAVGSPIANLDDVTAVGRAYVFKNNKSIPSATLENPQPAAHTQFGKAVAITGNWLAVSAPYGGPGKVHIFRLKGK